MGHTLVGVYICGSWMISPPNSHERERCRLLPAGGRQIAGGDLGSLAGAVLPGGVENDVSRDGSGDGCTREELL